MNTIEIILSILSGLGLTGSGLLGFILHRNTNKRLKEAEASHAEAQANQEEWALEHQRLEETHKTIMTLNEIIKSQGQTISANNKALDDKTKRIREAQDREFQANAEKAALAHQVTDLTREMGELKLRLQKNECIKLSCIHRDPPNEHTLAAIARQKSDETASTKPKK